MKCTVKNRNQQAFLRNPLFLYSAADCIVITNKTVSDTNTDSPRKQMKHVRYLKAESIEFS